MSIYDTKAGKMIRKLEDENTYTSLCILAFLQTMRNPRGLYFTSGDMHEAVSEHGFSTSHVHCAIRKLEAMNLIISIRWKGRTYFEPLLIENEQIDFWFWYCIPF